MLLLTDDPDAAAGLCPAVVRWVRQPITAWSGDRQKLWRALGAGDVGYAGEATDASWPGAKDRTWVLIDRAPCSQFNALLTALDDGVDLPDGLVCVARSGTGFRGQGGRPWSALAGNLHLTLHYRIDAPARDIEAGLVMLPAVAAVEAIETLSGDRLTPRIKWTNDVLIDGRKVAGVLTQTRLEGERISRVIFGIGMNLECEPALPSPDTPAARGAPPAGALALFDASLAGRLGDALRLTVAGADRALAGLLDDGPTSLYARYQAAAGFVGRSVRIWPTRADAAAPLATGRVAELLPDLSLRIAGHAEPIRNGRMELLTAEQVQDTEIA